MKRWHFIVESFLMLITFIFGITVPLFPDALFGFASWLLILGFAQVGHSIILVVINSNDNAILKWIFLYWGGVLLDSSYFPLTLKERETG